MKGSEISPNKNQCVNISFPNNGSGYWQNSAMAEP